MLCTDKLGLCIPSFNEEIKQAPSLLLPLQDFLGFIPSRRALAVVEEFVQAQAARQQQWALTRLQLAAVLTARRCAASPLYGQDLRKVPMALQMHVVVAIASPMC